MPRVAAGAEAVESYSQSRPAIAPWGNRKLDLR